MFQFMNSLGFDRYTDFHRWSIENVPAFWEALVEYTDVKFATNASVTLVQPGDMTTATFLLAPNSRSPNMY